MIKLQDFAKQMNVTDRALQKHLKNYADEFAGLYQRKGPNGTWLTDEACELLRSKMRIQPTAVADAKVYRELEAAQQQVRFLESQVTQLSKWKADNAVLLAKAEQTQLLLEGTKAELDQERIDRAKEQAAHEIELQKAAEDLDDEKNAHAADNKAAADREKDLRADVKELRQQLEAEKNRRLTWKERFTGKKG